MIYSTSFLAIKSIRLVQKWLWFCIAELNHLKLEYIFNIIMLYIILMHIPHLMFFPNDIINYLLYIYFKL